LEWVVDLVGEEPLTTYHLAKVPLVVEVGSRVLLDLGQLPPLLHS
jgi:hypothetical protein